MNIFLLILALISIVFALIAIFSGSESESFNYTKEHERIAEVVHKEYVPETKLEEGQSKYDMYPDGFRGFHRMYPDYQDEEHNVHLKDDTSSVIKVNSKELFNSVEKGDQVVIKFQPKRFVINPRHKMKMVSIKKKDLT